MKPGALLDLATALLRQVQRFDQPTDGVLATFFRQQKLLGARERHALAEMVYAVLRQRLLLQHLANTPGAGGGALERRLAMLAWPSGEHNLLRGALGPHEQQWLAEVQRIDRTSLPDKLRHNLPDWLAGALHAQLDEPGFCALAAALDQPAPLDLRVNLLKGKRDDALASLTAAGIAAAPTPFSPWGLRVQGKPVLNPTEAFKSGLIEVQDEGSQLLALLTDAKRGEMVADFCAGAGGKTLALGAAMRNTGRLYAFDTSGHRLAALKPRLARSGLSNVYPVQIAHERDDRVKRLAGKIDRVLVDAPCSGLGTLRRNPDLKWRQSPTTVAEQAEQQRAILASAARLVKPGGRLVYATCSLLAAENEEVAGAFAASDAGREFTPVAASDALRAAHVSRPEALVVGDHLRLWPHQHSTDGFFAAIWQRRD